MNSYSIDLRKRMSDDCDAGSAQQLSLKRQASESSRKQYPPGVAVNALPSPPCSEIDV